MVANTDYVPSQKSKGLSDETIKSPTMCDSLTPRLNYYGTKIRVKFTGSCLKQPKNCVHSWKSSEHLHCLLT